ncbi:hypothetical protein CAPTEDRAFT_180238 [Capitella teleta]|uniref:CAP-Gly domain-containing protein n=1 Tax=Capitella teleta TaxID=283909 RepID=N1PBE5_CAPTE|nr:hypothetical protein CAPTEDRAFT_180238 [Capitella teleta]|eukprot:ELU18914.1 hypothetical protein CAPTEDRAFT_180238 [Capitella teleta]
MMTQGHGVRCSPMSHGAPGPLHVNFESTESDRPVVHAAVDAPVCDNCLAAEPAFCDPNCENCQEILLNPSTSIAQLFAVLRQWTPQTQQNLEILVREILKRGARIDDRDGLTDMTLLHYVSKAGARGLGEVDECCRMVHLLISKGCDVFAKCRWTNMSALHYATYFDVSPVVQILLASTKSKDVDTRCAEFDHGTPLHIAACNLAYDSAQVLLEHGANPLIRDGLNRTPLDCIPDPEAFDPDSETGQLVRQLQRLFHEAEENPPMPLNAYNESSTEEMYGLKVGDKVVVGGVKTGYLRFCGPTDFADGLWGGIELEEAAGKNDGSVAGVNYFKCPPKYGIFAPLNKISKAGILLSGQRPTSVSVTLPSPLKVTNRKMDTSHVTARVDTGQLVTPHSFYFKNYIAGLLKAGRSLSVVNGPVEELVVGERVLVAGQRKGVIRFCGETDFAPGLWYGVELDRPVGKNDGSVNGHRYFECRAKCGVFAPPTRVQRLPDMDESLEPLKMQPLEPSRRLSNGSNGSQLSPNSSFSKKTSRPWSSGPVGLQRRSSNLGSGELKLCEGMSVFCNNELGIVRYMGAVEFAEGVWLGLELRGPKGKNDGSVQGKRYFTCRPNHGLLVRPSKVSVRGINGAKLLG